MLYDVTVMMYMRYPKTLNPKGRPDTEACAYLKDAVITYTIVLVS